MTTLQELVSGIFNDPRAYAVDDCVIEMRWFKERCRIEIKDGQSSPSDSHCGVDLLIAISETDSMHVTAVESEINAFALRWQIGPNEQSMRRIPPYDLLDLAWEHQIHPLPGVDVTWTTHATLAPFGRLTITTTVRDGAHVQVTAYADVDADATFSYPARRHMHSRTGQISVPETIGDDGAISGDLDAMLLIAGLLERADWVRARHIPPHDRDALELFYDLAEQGFFDPLAGTWSS